MADQRIHESLRLCAIDCLARLHVVWEGAKPGVFSVAGLVYALDASNLLAVAVGCIVICCDVSGWSRRYPVR
jgi:hypothetical protein